MSAFDPKRTLAGCANFDSNGPFLWRDAMWFVVDLLFAVYLATLVYLASRRGWKTWQACLAGFLLGSFATGIASVAREFSFESFVEGVALFSLWIAQEVISTIAEYTELSRLFSSGGLNYFSRSSNIGILAALIMGLVAAIQGSRRVRWLVISIGAVAITGVNIAGYWQHERRFYQKDPITYTFWTVFKDQTDNAIGSLTVNLIRICLSCLILWTLIYLFRWRRAPYRTGDV